MSNLIILPTPLPLSSIALGQLITDPISAETISFSPSAQPSRQQSSKQLKYQETLAQDHSGRFLHTVSNPSLSADEDSLLILNAEESSHASLTQPRASFGGLCHDAAAQNFLRTSALKRQPLYYVTGIQTLKTPTLKRAVVKDGAIAEAPVSELRLPTHVRRVDSASSLDNNDASKADGRTDEAIFAVELLKVRCCVGAANEPHSLEDIDYEWTYHSLDDDQDLQLSIGLGQALQASELRSLAGIVADEDFTDASWDSRSEDHEDGHDGIGGF